ncbi:MAG: M28 family peptidase [Acidobacteria bacterium]|nr:M28 family peptidase [Acidobacteriota bacterium]
MERRGLMKKNVLLPIICCLILISASFGCGGGGTDIDKALATITADELSADTKVLGSDEFEGRFPASKGEELTIAFMEKAFREAGAEPGNGDSYVQDVPMVEITNDPAAVLAFNGGSKNLSFPYGDSFVSWTLQVKDRIEINEAELVYVGYGIVAPEYGWNDYEGVDVKGKAVVILVNDPGFATEDPEVFKGRAMTYYGRWTYKFEEAARQGAAAALIIHETEPAAYGWEVVYNSWNGPRFSLQTDDDNVSRCAMESWIALETTKDVFDAAGMDFAQAKEDALKADFKALPLGQTLSVSIDNKIRRVVSRNIIAKVPGSDRADECIIYTAHWDHFGRDANLEGDQIYNGALDNATGTAALIELAEAFKALKKPPRRTVYFLAVTAEEQGLLGSEFYAANPVVPLTKTAAVLNMDSLNIFGRMKDIRVTGYGQSDLDDYVHEVAEMQDRVVLPNPTPEKGGFFRSDHFPFAKKGVPAVYAGSGFMHREKGEEYGKKVKGEYGRLNYHKVSDEYDPAWDLSGTVEDLQLYFRIGFKISNEDTFPGWKDGSEFKAVRDEGMRRE